MAVVATNLTSNTSAVSGTSFATASVTPAANALILISVGVRNGATANPTISSITGNSLTWVAVGNVNYDNNSSSRRTLFVYRALGTAPTAGAITITTGETDTNVTWSVDQFTGVDAGGTNGSAAVVQSATNFLATGAPNTTLVTTLAAFSNTANATFGAIANDDGTAWGMTAGAGFTQVGIQPVTGVGVFTEFKNTNDTTVDTTFTSQDEIGCIGIEIKAIVATFLEPGTDATQDFSFFAGTLSNSGSVTSDSSQSNTGSRSIKADISSSNGSSNADAFTFDNVVADTGSLVSAWFRFSTATPASRCLFMGACQTNNGSNVIYVGLNTNGTLHIGGRGTTFTDGATVLSANTWYRISVGWIITTTTNWSMVVYINGVQEATRDNTNGTLSLTSAVCAPFGVINSSQESFNTPPVISVWVDDIYIDNRTNKSDCGNVHVTAKRPNANGTANNFTTQIGAGGSGYGTGHSPQVNERPLSTTNGWAVTSAGSAITEEYNIESAATGDVDISAATLVDYMGWLYTKALIAETGNIIVNGVSNSISITTSNAMFTKAAGSATYPAGTGLDIGEQTSTTVTTVSLYECGILFAYIPAVVVSGVKQLAAMGVG